MKTILRFAVIVLLAVGGVALATDYTFSVSEGEWQVTTNWSPNGRPVAGDTATIGANKLCKVVNAEAVESVTVSTGLMDGNLNIRLGGALDLGAGGSTSTVNGDLTFGGGSGDPPQLVIKNDLTIQGSGSIDGADGAGGLITYVTTNYRLTINESVVLEGDMAVSCEFTNSARVSAGANDKIELLDGSNPDDDNGIWEITSSSGEIDFQDTAVTLNGDFSVAGTLRVQQSVVTTGELSFKQNGVIAVTAGKIFRASGVGG